MSGLARECGAINLSQGFPDFPVDPELQELVLKQMREGHNQYAPMPGAMPLREAISSLVADCYQVDYHPETEITVTAGATEALFCAITSVIHPGDEVIIFEPAYDSYLPVIQLNGGIPVPVKLMHPDYRPDWAEVGDKITGKTRAIIINTPHNPTGAVWESEDLDRLEKLAEAHDLVIISDEVYEHIIFDGKQHESVARRPGLRERSFVISSFGKTFHVTGWKTGYCLGPKDLMAEFRKIHQFDVFSVSTPFQMAFAGYLENRDKVNSLGKFYQAKRDKLTSLMSGTGFQPLACGGTYFQLYDYSQISDLPDVEFAEWLTREKKVAVIPVSVFYSDKTDRKVVRFCFAKEENTLQQAAGNLKA